VTPFNSGNKIGSHKWIDFLIHQDILSYYYLHSMGEGLINITKQYYNPLTLGGS
jgi:hypothetical protein